MSLKNSEKHSILFIGSQIALTPENPGPVAVNIDSLTREEVQQILFNVRMGILSTEYDISLLEKRLGFKTEIKTEVRTVPKKIESIKKDTDLKKLLAKKIGVVKKEASELEVSDLRKLIDLEQSGKNRKSLVPFLGEMYSLHVEQVASKLDSLGKNSEKDELSAQSFLDDLPDVIESDGIEVDIPLSD
jgi:hypothetical protein